MTDNTSHISSSICDLEDGDLVKTVDTLQTEVKNLQLENQVFENFLLKNDPALIAGMSEILDTARRMQNMSSLNLASPSRRPTDESIITTSRKTESYIRLGAPTASIIDRGPRINLSQKMDLAMREMEEMQLSLEEVIKKAHVSKSHYKAQLEEICMREGEVREARDIFEQSVVIEGVDSLTQKIPAEKFIRYMEEWLRSAEFMIEKMRLRSSTLKSQYSRVKSQLVQREELGEKLQAVDFEQLQIENHHLADKIEQKNHHLLELKKMNGRANLVLSTHKKFLQKQVHDLNKMKTSISSTEKKIQVMDKEADDVEDEVRDAQDKYDHIKSIITNYKVPDVLEYVKVKAELYELKKTVKIWARRNNILQFALNTFTRKMKNLTGSPVPLPEWYQELQYKDFFADMGSVSSYHSDQLTLRKSFMK